MFKGGSFSNECVFYSSFLNQQTYSLLRELHFDSFEKGQSTY